MRFATIDSFDRPRQKLRRRCPSAASASFVLAVFRCLDLGGQILEVLFKGLDFLRLLLVQTVQGVGATAPVVHILLASRLGFEFGLLLRLLRFRRGLLTI